MVGRGDLRWPSLARGIKAVALVIGLGIPGFVASNLHLQYRQDLRAAEVNTANTAHALEVHAERTIELIDTYLQAVISLIGSRVEDQPAETLHKALRDRVVRSPQLTNIVILDATGEPLSEAVAFPARTLDRRSNDYFAALRADPSLGLFVGAPVTGHLSKRLVLPLARRINRADGSFAGVIVATLDAATFQSVFDAFDLGPNSTLGLLRADGTLLVRSPYLPTVVGRNYGTSDNYRRYVVPRDARPFWAIGSTDGILRVQALGFVPSYPLYVIATQTSDTALAQWRQAAWAEGITGGGLTLVLVAALVALAREIQRRQRFDIQLREAERGARASSDLLRTTLDNMEQGLIEIDADGLVQVCNRRARDLLDLPGTIMAARPSFRSVLEWQRDHGSPAGSDAEFEQFVRDGTVVSAPPVFERACRDGRVLEVRTAALAHGGAVRTYTDITQRRLSEEALKDSEARYRLLAEAATDMIVLTDLDLVQRYVSPASRDLLGHAPEDMVGARVVATAHPDDADGMADAFAALRDAAVEQASTVGRLRRADGTYVWVEAKLRLVRQEGTGDPSGIICAVRDISERQRKAEELGLAKEAAEAGARAKGEFLASMSHELRTPLNSIIGFSGLMVEDAEMTRPTLQRYAGLVRDASITLLSIVNDVLDVSKMESGSLELDPRPFLPRDLVEGAGALLRGTAEDKGLTLHVAVDPAVPPVLIGDDARLRQVLLNLLSNAVKFTARGSVRLACEREAGDDGLARLRFRVSDTGIGIPADGRDRLFQRFSQIDSSTARRFGGTGLGLSICRSLLGLMGSTIELESREGEGSTFAFALDLPVGAVAAAPARPAPRISCWPRTWRSTRSSWWRCSPAGDTRSTWSPTAPRRSMR